MDEILERLVAEYSDGNKRVALAIIERLGVLAQSLLPMLENDLGGPDDGLSQMRRSTVDALRGGRDDLMSRFLRRLSDPKTGDITGKLADECRTGDKALAMVLIGELGNLARPFVPILAAGLGHAKEEIRRLAAHVLHGLGSEAREASVQLAESLGDPSPRVRVKVAATLCKIGQSGRARDVIRELVDAPDITVRIDAAAALGGCLAEEGTAMKILAAAMRSENSAVRKRAALSLWEVNPRSESSVPPLVGALRDPEPLVRITVLGILGSMGPRAKAAVEALRGFRASEEDEAVRKAADMALARITGELRHRQSRIPGIPGIPGT